MEVESLNISNRSRYTGVPFHIHGPTFAETIYGRKVPICNSHACVNSFIHNSQRWFLYSPDLKPIFDPNVSTLDWLYEVYPMIDQKPLECVFHPGEVNIF